MSPYPLLWVFGKDGVEHVSSGKCAHHGALRLGSSSEYSCKLSRVETLNYEGYNEWVVDGGEKIVLPGPRRACLYFDVDRARVHTHHSDGRKDAIGVLGDLIEHLELLWADSQRKWEHIGGV